MIYLLFILFYYSSSLDYIQSQYNNENLIKLLKEKKGIIKSEKIYDAMIKINRANFVPTSQLYNAYTDIPLSIGFEATISAPHMHALCLESLLPVLIPGARILDIGSGSGYLTTLFATIVGPTGHVVGIDHVKELVEWSWSNINKEISDISILNVIKLVTEDGRKGWSEFAPYDAIHIGAASSTVPNTLISQLKVGGMIIIPLESPYYGYGYQILTLFQKINNTNILSHLKKIEIANVKFVPLTSLESQLRSNENIIEL